jgi:hypothetical protein
VGEAAVNDRAPPLRRHYDAAGETAARVIGDYIAGPPALAPGQLPPPFTSLDAVIWNLNRLARTTITPEVEQRAVGLVAALPEHAAELQRAFITWVDVVETLVQVAEQDTDKYSGPEKAARVRASVIRIIDTAMRRYDRDAGPLLPVLTGPIIDWLIDIVVLALDRYGLWAEPVAPKEPGVLGHATAAMRKVVLLVGRLLARVCRALSVCFAVLARRLDRASPIDDHPWVAQDAAAAALASSAAAVPALAAEFAWLGAERAQLVKAVDLVFSAVQLAEAEPGLSDPRKKAYAVDLVMLTLEDLGVSTRMADGARPLVAAMIEATVHLFHKHGVAARC